MLCNVLLIDLLVKFIIIALFSVVPPERPTAPKPGQQQQLPGAAFDMPQDAGFGMPGSLGQPSVMGMPPLPSSDAPKLKDFLPFMKPGSFGPRAQAGSRPPNDCAPGSAGSLPASVAASPVHLPRAPVSFPPSPQRQPPVSVTTSNGYSSVPFMAGSGVVHASAEYPVAEALLSPTAPPGAPRSASPAHQLPPSVAHPGGPAEGQQQPPRQIDMSYNIPQSNSQSYSGGMPLPASTDSHTGGASASYAGQNGHLLSSQGYMQVTQQPPMVNSGPGFGQPGMSVSDGHIQHTLPSNTSSFQSQVPSVVSNAATAANVPPTASTHPQHIGLPYSNVDSIGTSAVSTNLNQSYLGATGNSQQPNMGTTIPGVPVQQVNNSNNVLGQFPSVAGSHSSNIEVSRPHYNQPPIAVPPTCAAMPSAYHSQQPRPPSYEVVTQHYPPPSQPVNPSYPSIQPGFTGPPASAYIPPQLSSAGVTAPVQPSYHSVSTVRPEVSYGNVHAGHLPAGNQQPVTSMQLQHTISAPPQPLPPSRQVMPGTSQGLVPASQQPVMPASAQQSQLVNQNQPRYPLASQTVPGLPVPSQYPSAISHVPSHLPSQAQFPANVQMPATPAQPRYPSVPNVSHPHPAGVQQFQPAYNTTSQQPAANQMHPAMHVAASRMQPAVTSQQQQYQQFPVQPNQPTIGHAEGYIPGNPPQPAYPGTNQAYQASNQPLSVYQQPPSVTSQQQNYQSFTAQQQPFYHPGSSQPLVINQSSAVSSNFSTAQTPHSVPHTSAPFTHSVDSASAFADIPVCLPSPLQPSRATAVEVSKNVDSLSDLDLSGKTSAGDAQPKQNGSRGQLQNADTAEVKDMAVDSSAASKEEQREKSEEETRHSLRQSRYSRDVYADSDTLTRFVAEVEKFQKHVDSLVKPTLGGYFPLDKEWKVRFLLSVCVCLPLSVF